MNFKQAVAGVSFAGGVGLALMGVGPGIAYAAPGGGDCMPPACAGGPGPAVPRGGDYRGDGGRPGDYRGDGGRPGDYRGDGGRPGDFRGDGGRPDDFRGDGGRPGDFRGPDGPGGPRDFGPRPGDAFRGFRDAPWGDGAAPWGWGAPPRAGWDRPLPPPGAFWDAGPINYWGFNETPIWDQGQNGWGFWFFGIWVPL